MRLEWCLIYESSAPGPGSRKVRHWCHCTKNSIIQHKWKIKSCFQPNVLSEYNIQVFLSWAVWQALFLIMGTIVVRCQTLTRCQLISGKNMRKITKWKQFTLFLMIWTSEWKYSGHYKHNKNKKTIKWVSHCGISNLRNTISVCLSICPYVCLSFHLCVNWSVKGFFLNWQKW